MRVGATVIISAIIAAFPSWAFAQTERPSWALNTDGANYPVQVRGMVFPNDILWDDDHPSVTVGRWLFTRSDPMIERLSTVQLGTGVPCLTSPNRSDCFYAIIAPFNCYNSAVPTHTSCAMVASWSAQDGAICQIFAGPPPPPDHFPARDISFRIACPMEIHYVN